MAVIPNSNIFYDNGLVNIASGTTTLTITELQDVSVAADLAPKLFQGGTKFAQDAAEGAQKLTVKAKTRNLSVIGEAFLLGGTVSATTVESPVICEQLDLVSGSAGVAHSATLSSTLGVFSNAGKQMTVTGSAPAVGSYSISSGTITCNASETSPIFVNYTYAASGSKGVGANANLGRARQFELSAWNTFGSHFRGRRFPAVVVKSVNQAAKGESYTEYDVEFDVLQTPGQNAWEIIGDDV